jgi:phosphate acetyltransferase/phosphate butyryltransferase
VLPTKLLCLEASLVFGQHRGDLNAIELSHALGVPEPRVAILSAVETVTEKIKSTLDTAALCKMADRRQITGGILDGPLAFGNAVSEEAATTKGIVSSIAGRARHFRRA